MALTALLKLMKLNIYSLKKTLFHGEAIAVNCKTVSGEITVLDHHRPLVSVLAAGIVKVTGAGKNERYFAVSSGFLEVQDTNTIRMLVEEQA